MACGQQKGPARGNYANDPEYSIGSIPLVLFYWFYSTSSTLLVLFYWFYSIGSIGISNEIKKGK